MVIRYRPIGDPETSVRNDYTLRNSPEECSSRLRPGGNLKSRMHNEVQFNYLSDEAFQCVSVPYSITTVFNFLYLYIYIFIYLLQLGCYPVAVVILHVNKT